MTCGRLGLHRLSEESLLRIATGDAGVADLRLLASAQRSRLLLVLRSLLDHSADPRVRARPGPGRRGGVPSAGSAWRLLSEVQDRDPGAVDAVLDDPSVMAWAMRLLRRLRGAAPEESARRTPLWADLGQFQVLAAAAALRAGHPAVLRVPAFRGMVWLPGAGVAGPVSGRRWSEAVIEVGQEGAVVRGEQAEVLLPAGAPAPVSAARSGRRATDGDRTPGRGGPVPPQWLPMSVVGQLAGRGAGPGPVLRLDSVTPHRDFRVAPRAPDRTGQFRSGLWNSRVGGACALLARESPADAAALAALVRVLVPRSFPSSRGGLVASASSPDAFGAVTLSLPYDEPQTAAVLVHETRHQQLNALLGLVPLVRAPDDVRGPHQRDQPQLYYAPWRSDPRPAHGLLHGVFAFSGMARFWLTHRPGVTGTEVRRAEFEFAVFREQVGEAVALLLAGDELTEAGRLFAEEIERLNGRWLREEVGEGPARLAAHYCALRRSLWRARHQVLDEGAAGRIAGAWAAGQAAGPLPPSVVRPDPAAIRVDTFGVLCRLYLSAPGDFARRRRRAERDGDLVGMAECAAVAGDAAEAARHYARWSAGDPHDADAWAGAALALPPAAAGGPAALLLERPEVVAAVRRALARADRTPPDAGELARWLTGGRGASPAVPAGAHSS